MSGRVCAWARHFLHLSVPYRIPSPPDGGDAQPDGEHPYVAVLAATRRRTRIGAVAIVGALCALPYLLSRRSPLESHAMAGFEAQSSRANESIESARRHIRDEQEIFDRTIRDEAKRVIPTPPEPIGCSLRLDPDQTRFGPSFPLLVVSESELAEKLPSQSIASMLLDAERAERLVMTARPAHALAITQNLLGPGRLRQEVVLVTKTHVPPKAKTGGAYEPGHVTGRAFVYDFASRTVGCYADIETYSSRSIGYAYATGADALPGVSAEASMNATLEDDFRRNIERAIAKNLVGY